MAKIYDSWYSTEFKVFFGWTNLKLKMFVDNVIGKIMYISEVICYGTELLEEVSTIINVFKVNGESSLQDEAKKK